MLTFTFDIISIGAFLLIALCNASLIIHRRYRQPSELLAQILVGLLSVYVAGRLWSLL